jgi:hypothetical protein
MSKIPAAIAVPRNCRVQILEHTSYFVAIFEVYLLCKCDSSTVALFLWSVEIYGYKPNWFCMFSQATTPKIQDSTAQASCLEADVILSGEWRVGLCVSSNWSCLGLNLATLLGFLYPCLACSALALKLGEAAGLCWLNVRPCQRL